MAPTSRRSLDDLADRVIACRTCPRLVAWREEVAQTKRAAFADEDYWGKAVPGFGDPNARIVVVGLAPAAHGANRTGRMFTGDRSGDWLFGALHRAGLANQAASTHLDDGLELTDVWVTSPVKCAPPANSPTAAERQNCAPFLTEEFELLDSARVVVALGGVGTAAVARHFDLRPRPKFGHGLEYAIPGLGTLLTCFHVSQLNTFTGRLTEDMLDQVFERARHLADRPVH